VRAKFSWLRISAFSALVACGGSQHVASTSSAPPGHGDRVPHTISAQEYAARLDDPARDAWQMPERVVAAIGVQPGMHVADVGTGSGYFLPYLDRAVAPNGSVLGEDIDPELLAIAGARVERQSLTRVALRQGSADDPQLEPGAFDVILVVDTYHHIAHREPFFRHVAEALRPGTGRVVIVDFRDGNLPVGPGPDHKIPRAQIEREMTLFGFTPAASDEILPYQFVLTYRHPP
jgi:SAM-dependent methyltransferase